MAINEKKMKIVMDNYFKAECTVNTSIREAFEKGFRIGVQKGYEAKPVEHITKVEKICYDSKGDIVDHSFVGMCRFCGGLVYSHEKFCSECGTKLDWGDDE